MTINGIVTESNFVFPGPGKEVVLFFAIGKNFKIK